MDLPKKAVELLACTTCNALPGDPCLTRTGRKLTDHGHGCHEDRVRPIREVWTDGYLQAERLVDVWQRRAWAADGELAAVRSRVIAALEGKSDD